MYSSSNFSAFFPLHVEQTQIIVWHQQAAAGWDTAGGGDARLGFVHSRPQFENLIALRTSHMLDKIWTENVECCLNFM
jgi:hypothetical protein